MTQANATTELPPAAPLLSRLGRAAVALAVILLAVPFLVVSVLLLARLPGSVWPLDFATITSVRDAALDVPEYPGATIGKPRLDDPTEGQWFGFVPPDVAVETRYTLPVPVPAATLIDYHLDQLPRLGWRYVRTERAAGETRLEFRRHVMALVVTVPGAPSFATGSYVIRVGPADGKTFRQGR